MTPIRESKRLLAILGIVSLLQMTQAPSLLAEEVKPRGVVIWDGVITITRNAQAEHMEETSKDGNTFNHFEKRVLDDTTTIQACGSKEHLHVYSAERTMDDFFEKSTEARAASTDCGPKEGSEYTVQNPPHIIKQPGNHSFRSNKMHNELAETKDSIPLKDRTSVTLMMMGGGFYSLHVKSLGAIRHLQDAIHEKYNACTGKTKRGEHYIRPADDGQPPSYSTDITELDWEGTRISRQNLPLFLLPVGFHGEGKVTGDILEGAVETSERGYKVKGGYDEITKSTWRLIAKNPCQEVYDQLMEDIAFAEAYVDPTIPPMVSLIIDPEQRIAEYEKLVDQAAWRNLHGEEPPEGDLTDADAAVGGDSSEVQGLDALRKKLADQCKHDIIFKSIEAHEKTHLKQYEKFKDEADSGSARIWGLMEVTAYMDGIQILMNWLEQNCPEINLNQAKERIRQIETTKLSRN